MTTPAVIATLVVATILYSLVCFSNTKFSTAALFNLSQNKPATAPTIQLLNAAVCEFLRNNSQPDNLFEVNKKWFGNRPVPLSDDPCNCDSNPFPSVEKLSPLANAVFLSKRMIFGANSITNVPKRFNAVPVGFDGKTYYKLQGFEADIAQALANIISRRYKIEPGIQAYFALSPWFANVTDNIIINLQNKKYDFILSGMTPESDWQIREDGARVDRKVLIDFTCPYQDDSEAAVKGRKPLPNGVAIQTVKDLNQTGVVICVQKGTTMATYAKTLTLATYRETDTAYQETLDGSNCHVYLAPIINSLYQAVNAPSNLTYVGPYNVGKPLGVGARKEEEVIGAASATSVSMIFAAFSALLSFLLL